MTKIRFFNLRRNHIHVLLRAPAKIDESGAEPASRDDGKDARQKFILYFDGVVGLLPEPREQSKVIGNAERMFSKPVEQRMTRIRRPDPRSTAAPLRLVRARAWRLALQYPVDLMAASRKLGAE